MGNSVRFKYVFSDDYTPAYVNGVYGGIGPHGEMVMNFYLERRPVPREETYAIEGETLGDRLDTVPDDIRARFIRFIQAGVIMDLQTAKSIREWMNQHIAEAEKLQGESSE